MWAGALRDKVQDRVRLVGPWSSRWINVTLGGSNGRWETESKIMVSEWLIIAFREDIWKFNPWRLSGSGWIPLCVVSSSVFFIEGIILQKKGFKTVSSVFPSYNIFSGSQTLRFYWLYWWLDHSDEISCRHNVKQITCFKGLQTKNAKLLLFGDSREKQMAKYSKFLDSL